MNTTMNTATNTSLGIDPPGTLLTFASMGQRPYNWLEITFPVDDEPASLLADLAAIGWAEKDTRRFPYPSRAVRGAVEYDEVKIHVAAPGGSGLFGCWNPTEKRGHMLAARRVLRGHGFHNVPVWRKAHADLV